MPTTGKIHEDVFKVHIRVNPAEQELLSAFLFDFDVTFGRRLNAANTTLSAYLLKPSKLLERTFGFKDEILLVVSDHYSLQPRTLQAVEQVYSEQPYRGRADPLTFIIVSRDRNIEDWITSYLGDHPQFRSPVAIPWEDVAAASEDRWFIRNKLSNQLFARDIFDYSLPLDNDLFFFGRGRLVDQILDSVRKSQNTGLFGLRKTGKTSLLYKVLRTCHENKIASVIYIDCKRPNIRQMSWRELLDHVTDNLREVLSLPKKAIKGREEVSRFRSVLSLAPSETRVAVIFDEIEYISPVSPLDAHWKRDYIDFWQTVWSVQSEIRKLSILVAGVNPYVCEVDLVDGVQNPMFGIVKDVMVTGLNKDETYSMIRRMGRQIGLNFDETALDYLNRRYGGHPLLTRLACSFTNKVIIRDGSKRPIPVSLSLLTRDEAERESDLQFYCRHVVSELKQFYEVEYELLQKIAAGDIVEFLEFAAEPEFIKHLKGYGLIAVDKSGKPEVKIPVIKRYIALELARQRRSGELRSVVPEAERSNWLNRRKDGILRDMKQLLKACDSNNKKGLYGNPYLVESDQFASIEVTRSWSNFVSFVNALYQSFVEPVDKLNGTKFFYNDMRQLYPHLFEAFNRIRHFRHNADHLRLRHQVEGELNRILEGDLFGTRLTNYRDPWFLLQQICLDEMFAAIQYERAALES